jgi:hypothetical protein
MKRLALVIALGLALSACAATTSPVSTAPPTGNAPTATAAAGNPTPGSTAAGQTAAAEQTSAAPATGSNVGITQTFFQPWDSGFGSVNFNIVIEVKNTGGKPANIHSGDQSLTILATDGTVLATGTFDQEFPQILAPGEFGYYIVQGQFDQGTKLTDVGKLQPSLSFSDSDKPAPPAWQFSSVKVDAADYTGGIQVSGIVKNTDTVDATMGMVAVVLFDANGKILGAVYDNVSVMNLRAGQSKGFKTSYPPTPKFDPTAVASYKTFGLDYSFF